MATKLIVVCDWHDTDAEATHHNEWTDLAGKRKVNDLCDSHQQIFLQAWQTIDKNSTSNTPATNNSRPDRKRPPRSQPTDTALARAWAQANGMEVNAQGRIGFHIEQAWKKAGRPNVLIDQGSTNA